MNIKIVGPSLGTIREILGDRQFGLVDSIDPNNDVITHSAVWTDPDGGFPVGRITQLLGSFPRYELELETDRIQTERLVDLMSAFANDHRR